MSGNGNYGQVVAYLRKLTYQEMMDLAVNISAEMERGRSSQTEPTTANTSRMFSRPQPVPAHNVTTPMVDRVARALNRVALGGNQLNIEKKDNIQIVKD